MRQRLRSGHSRALPSCQVAWGMSPAAPCTTQSKGPDPTGHTGAPAGRCGPGRLGNGQSRPGFPGAPTVRAQRGTPGRSLGPALAAAFWRQKWENGDPRPQDLALPGYCAHGTGEALPAFSPAGPSETPGWAGKRFSWSDPEIPAHTPSGRLAERCPRQGPHGGLPTSLWAFPPAKPTHLVEPTGPKPLSLALAVSPGMRRASSPRGREE